VAATLASAPVVDSNRVAVTVARAVVVVSNKAAGSRSPGPARR
jgi:hypothetical protein